GSQVAIDEGDFQTAFAFYNQQNYVKALPLLEKICRARTEGRQKPLAGQIPVEPNISTLERLLGIVLFEVGKQDEVRRGELWSRANPLLCRALVHSPGEGRLLSAMAEICLVKGDFEGEKHYRLRLAVLTYPSYGLGLQSYQGGRLKEAKAFLLQAIHEDPTFAESYFYLALCELADHNEPDSRRNFQKYLELAPKGKYAPAAIRMLKEKARKPKLNRARTVK
ncbi:MAG: hypothetical protein Q8O19_04470, partial [Rectinemataceae bacterium]|nr:hypothetical protein [Rectinemataceae bacterium]